MCYVTLDVDGNQLSWSLGWENKATKVDGTAAWWRHADGMTVTRGGSSLTNVIWTELVLVAAHSNLHVEDSDTSNIVIILLPLHLNLDTCGWCTMGRARLAGHGRVHPHQLATRHTRDWLHGSRCTIVTQTRGHPGLQGARHCRHGTSGSPI